jgi:hypothetical protein
LKHLHQLSEIHPLPRHQSDKSGFNGFDSHEVCGVADSLTIQQRNRPPNAAEIRSFAIACNWLSPL